LRFAVEVGGLEVQRQNTPVVPNDDDMQIQ
jgi:hypothetical protein